MFLDQFNYDSPLIGRLSVMGFAGGFDENRAPPRATQVQVEVPHSYR